MKSRKKKNLVKCLVMMIVLVMECESMVKSIEKSECLNVKTPLKSIRKRRHLTFPDNSDIVLTISLVKAFMTHAPSGWNIALEIDVLWPLPDSNFTNAQFRRKLLHRQKREFWEKLKSAIDFHNMNGRSCILRSICEGRVILAPPGKSLVHDILRAVFTAPFEDDEFKNEMRGSFNELMDPEFCDKENDCPFSLVDFVLALNKQHY